MAVQTTNTLDHAASDRFLDWLVTVMNRIWRSSPAQRCADEASRLEALSDAELARLGLTRDRIVLHAFARYIA